MTTMNVPQNNIEKPKETKNNIAAIILGTKIKFSFISSINDSKIIINNNPNNRPPENTHPIEIDSPTGNVNSHIKSICIVIKGISVSPVITLHIKTE